MGAETNQERQVARAVTIRGIRGLRSNGVDAVQEMTFRIATRTDLPELGLVRTSVKENRLSDLSVLNPGDIDRMLTGDGRGWVCEVNGRTEAFAMADLSGANLYALFVELGYERQALGATFMTR